MVQLPVDSLLPHILDHLRHSNTLVLEAPPGAGKTTRVPPALLSLENATCSCSSLAGWLHGWRRALWRPLAVKRWAKPSATRSASRRSPGLARASVLSQKACSPGALLSDPLLARAGSVVLDEFHERHLEGDTALALLRRLQQTRRPDLRLVVMSATLAAAPVAEYLGGATVLRSEGRQYPLDVEYTPHSAMPLEQQVAAAVERLGTTGHVLAFLPGAAEIRRAMAACEALARRRGALLLPLYGDLSPEEQDRAVGPSGRPKIILSTNVAESSITIEGVSAVIDSGLARVAGHSPWSGLPTLNVARISQASANQRAGRAGRTGPGRAIRLFPLEDFLRRAPHDTPEVLREDFSPVALMLHAMGIDELPWLDPPPEAAVAAAAQLLHALGAVDPAGRLTPSGREMARYPMHPRLARLVVEASRRGVADDGGAVAALLSAGERLTGEARHATRSDLLALLESRWSPRAARVVHQVRQLVKRGQKGRDEDALLISVLAAFPDRVARRRQGNELLLASGGSALLSPTSSVTEAPFLVAVEAEERSDQRLPLIRIASAVEPEWLLDLFPDRVTARNEVEWNRAGERVEAVSGLLFDGLVIEESRTMPDPQAAARLLAAKAMEAGIGRFAGADEVAAFLHRVEFAAAHASVPRLGDADIRAAFEELGSGLRTFAELKGAAQDGGLIRALERRLPMHRIEEVAPARIRLPGGRTVRVHYDPGQPPWIASRLQDFFGMRESPRIAGGEVPLVVRLLAPSQRPVQTTTDLAGFWERLYPQVRRELSRRYPKHRWPEDPRKML